MCAVTEDLLRSSHPLGPWEFIGEFKDEKGESIIVGDCMMFVDDDERVYMYGFSCRFGGSDLGSRARPMDAAAMMENAGNSGERGV